MKMVRLFSGFGIDYWENITLLAFILDLSDS